MAAYTGTATVCGEGTMRAGPHRKDYVGSASLMGFGYLSGPGSRGTSGSATISGTGSMIGHGARVAGAAVALHEHKELRTQSRVSQPWGTGTTYRRFFSCPKGNIADLLADELALGTIILSDWTDQSYSNGPEGPRLQSIERQQKKQSAADMLVVDFLEIDVLRSYLGYRETARQYPQSNTPLTDVTVTWGIASTETSTGLPDEGDHLDNGTSVTDPICSSVTFDDTAMHGRVLIKSVWIASRSEDSLLRASDVA